MDIAARAFSPSVHVAAVVLAAGRSRRMGRCKLTLPWGNTTVIGQVVATLAQAGAAPVLVVTAPPWHHEVLSALSGAPAQVVVYHPQDPEAMLLTVQWGLRHLPDTTAATFIALGDQPHIPVHVPQTLMATYQATGAAIVVPTHQGRKGHPWLVDRRLWSALLRLPPTATLRDFLHQHREQLYTVPVDTPSIHWDMDNPQDYRRLRAWWEYNQYRATSATPHPRQEE